MTRRIGIATPCGRVGNLVTTRLVAEARRDTELVLLCRDPAKLPRAIASAVQVERGDLADGDYVRRATRNLDVLFWATPPPVCPVGARERQLEFGRAAADAIHRNRVPRVVNLSSLFSLVPEGAGADSGLHEIEGLIDEATADVTHIRPTYYMDNYLHQLPAIAQVGAVYLPVSGARLMPMVAAVDVAAAIVEELLAPPTGTRTRHRLGGVGSVSFDQAASAIGEGLGRPVRHMEVSSAHAHGALLGRGLSPAAAEAAVAFYAAVQRGCLTPPPDDIAPTRSATSIANFARTTLRPLLGGGSQEIVCVA